MGTSKVQPSDALPDSPTRLDSWKEIAAYLKRDERTVRRWEAEGLPVHRKVHNKRASIYAFKSELDAWWNNGRNHLVLESPQAPTAPVSNNARWLRQDRLWIPAVGLVVLLAGVLLYRDGGIRRRIFPPPAPTIRSIAVLPLENLSADVNQEYFVDGMTDALITDLAQISELKVISRTSAMQYKGVRKPLPEVAKALGVDAVVEGSVVRSGDKVRITAQLIYAPGDRHLWAESFEGEARDILSIQDDVARAVANHVQGKLSSQLRQTTAHKPVNPDSYEAYLRGRYFWNKWTPAGSQKAIEYFNAAIAKDPNYALAYSGLANVQDSGRLGDGCAPTCGSGVKSKVSRDEGAGIR